MDYARKVVYKGNIVDVEDIVCPGTELAHLSVGNLKKRMNEFVKILNEFRVQIKNIEENIEHEFNIIKKTIDKNTKSYETIITTRLNNEKLKYDALYEHANTIIADSKNENNALSINFSELDENVTEIKERINQHDELIGHVSLTDATLADQIINIKKQINTLILWKDGLYNAIVDSTKIEALKQFKAGILGMIIGHSEDELKYEDINNLTTEWEEYLTEHHPINKKSDEEVPELDGSLTPS